MNSFWSLEPMCLSEWSIVEKCRISHKILKAPSCCHEVITSIFIYVFPPLTAS